MRNPRATRSSIAIALSVLSLGALALPREAAACGMSVRLEPTPAKPSPVLEVARAEKALEAGQPAVAARAVLGTFPTVRVLEPGKDPLATRALRVFALAVVRSDGAVQERKLGAPGGDAWTQRSNLEWAAQALREIDAKRPNDPALQADLGEALARLPHTEGDAMLMLARLAQKDLMGSPHAYAALARLRAKAGDDKGAEAARGRCEEMSKTKDICRPDADKAKAVPAPSVAAKV